MADIDFPPALRDRIALPRGYKSTDFVVRDSSNSTGAPRARAQFTRTLDRWPVRCSPLYRSECDQLEEFFRTTTLRGSLKFNMPHVRQPATGSRTVEVRMFAPEWLFLGRMDGREVWAAEFEVYEV